MRSPVPELHNLCTQYLMNELMKTQLKVKMKHYL